MSGETNVSPDISLRPPHSQITDVLVPTDGKTPVYPGFELVAPLFETARSTIHTLHVETPEAGEESFVRYTPSKGAERKVTSLTERFAELGFETKAHVARGEPAQEIAKVATAMAVDMIVMVTTHANTLLSKSTTQTVISVVDIPVVTIHAESVRGATERP